MGKNEIDLMILGVLMAGPAHGYQIKKRIASTFGDQYPHLSDSAIYPRLINFDKEGLVKSQIQMQYNAPNKKVYQLTEAGLKKIKALAATPVKANKKITNADGDDLIIHILFFSLISREERKKIIEPFYNYSKWRRDTAIEKLEKYKSQIDKFALVLFEYGIPMGEKGLEMYQKLMDME
jgi:DNA-binding PadR family transcriptional regulator